MLVSTTRCDVCIIQVLSLVFVVHQSCYLRNLCIIADPACLLLISGAPWSRPHLLSRRDHDGGSSLPREVYPELDTARSAQCLGIV